MDVLFNNPDSTQVHLSNSISSLNSISTDFISIKKKLNNTNTIIDDFEVPLSK